ncbi:MAG TPA: protein translocase subunit SecD [Trebonia sp.]|nr:protein translocase subunit SecD [Trebonia sp.]
MIILILLFSVLGSATIHPGKWHNQFKVGLGLDLSSGTQVTLQAQTANGKPPQAGEMTQAINVLNNRVNGTGNSGAQVTQVGSNLITVSVPGKAPQDVINLISTTAELRFRPVYLEEPYTPPTASQPKTSGSATPSTSPSGSPSSSTTPKPSAGSTPKPSSTKAGTTAFIKPDASSSTTPSSTATPTSTAKATSTASAAATPTPSASASASAPTTYGDASEVNAATMKLFNELKCTPSTNANAVNDAWKSTVKYSTSGVQYNNLTSQTVSCDSSGTKYVLGPAVFAGTDITNVNVNLLQNNDQYVVNLTLNPAGTSAFGKLTQNQYTNYYTPYEADSTNINDEVLDETAVVLDGDIQSAPITTSPIETGQVQITGGGTSGFSQDQANQLANVLKFGALPLSFLRQQVTSISASLGHDSLVAGLAAGVIGLIVVIIYLFMYYRGLGIVSVSSLLLAALLAYLAVVVLSKYQNFTMELSGIAGLIVAIGITADSFIVFFERLRDEVREGKSLRPAVESGWKRARRTILVSDTVSFLAAVLLYHFAVSDVQGFAYTLGLTTLIDVLVVFLFTKPLVTLLAGTKFFGGGHKWSGLDPARLGAKNPWRGRRTVVRSQRPRPASTTAGSAAGPTTGASTPTEA